MTEKQDRIISLLESIDRRLAALDDQGRSIGFDAVDSPRFDSSSTDGDPDDGYYVEDATIAFSDSFIQVRKKTDDGRIFVGSMVESGWVESTKSPGSYDHLVLPWSFRWYQPCRVGDVEIKGAGNKTVKADIPSANPGYDGHVYKNTVVAVGIDGTSIPVEKVDRSVIGEDRSLWLVPYGAASQGIISPDKVDSYEVDREEVIS